jgi:hypothetical protein
MPFVAFHKFCPEVAARETRTIHVLPGSNLGVPPADYHFEEMYCDERGCDCRRVMFAVMSSARGDMEAVIAWGWESRDFYARWMHMDDPAMLDELQGPILNLGSPQSQHAGALLRIAQQFLLSDPAYVERIKRHYALFREHIDPKKGHRARGKGAAGRDDPKGAPESSEARRRQAWRKGGSGGGP